MTQYSTRRLRSYSSQCAMSLIFLILLIAFRLFPLLLRSQVRATDRDCSPDFGDVCGYEILTQNEPFQIDREGKCRLMLPPIPPLLASSAKRRTNGRNERKSVAAALFSLRCCVVA